MPANPLMQGARSSAPTSWTIEWSERTFVPTIWLERSGRIVQYFIYCYTFIIILGLDLGVGEELKFLISDMTG